MVFFKSAAICVNLWLRIHLRTEKNGKVVGFGWIWSDQVGFWFDRLMPSIDEPAWEDDEWQANFSAAEIGRIIPDDPGNGGKGKPGPPISRLASARNSPEIDATRHTPIFQQTARFSIGGPGALRLPKESVKDERWHNSIIASWHRAPVSVFISVDFFEAVGVRAAPGCQRFVRKFLENEIGAGE